MTAASGSTETTETSDTETRDLEDAMSLAELTRYTDKAQDVTWLGQLVTYTVTETSMPHAQLVRLLTQHGLEDHAPKRPADSDVFRRVCSAAETSRVPTADPDVFTNVMVRNVGTNGDIVLKKIVAESVDGKGQRLTYEEVYDLTFDKETGGIRTLQLVPGHPAADDVAATIRREYPAQQGCIDGGAIRTLIRRALASNHAVSVRDSGGLYFIMQTDADVVDRLHRLAGDVPGTKLYRIPLIDDGEQRDLIAESAEADTLADVDRALTEIARLLNGERVSTAAAATVVRNFQHLKDRAERYEELLESTLGGVGARMKVLDLQVAEIMRKAGGAPAEAAPAA